MNATEQARRSDALYFSGNDGINRRWLCDKVASLESEVAKLKELTRILAYCMSENRNCDRCALNGASMPTPIISACDSLPEMLRKFGVEVD